ncbi:MAG: transcriptional repressor [Alphaproteobacteria bacterium]|nr:transcriptional repressor [Alphaproteobacteria bacterium]
MAKHVVSGSKRTVRAVNAATLARLREAGLRPTRQRLALAALLFDGHPHGRHVSAEALFGEVRAAGAKVSLATVYNTLHQFTAAGLLRELVVDPGTSLFDTNVGDHHHLYFEDSGDLRDVDADRIEIKGLPATPKGAEVARVDVIVRLRRRS